MTTLTLSEASQFLHMHPVTLKIKAKDGIVPAAKIGGKWLFIESDLTDYNRRDNLGEHHER